MVKFSKIDKQLKKRTEKSSAQCSKKITIKVSRLGLFQQSGILFGFVYD